MNKITQVEMKHTFDAAAEPTGTLIITPVTPTLNVSRKFSMCIIFSTGYIKIYNLITSNECHIQPFKFVHQNYYTTIQEYRNAFLNPCEHPAAGTNEFLLNIHSTTSLLNCLADLKQIRIGMRHNVSVSST